MRNKKLLSTVVATALAATMAMPVMAAETGNVPVDVTTKMGVLRVEVPTKMTMEIDQFEIAQAGAQIASGEFKMKNLSDMDVKVDVTSEATLGNGITLVGTKQAAVDSKGNEAWLAAAAMTAEDAYTDGTTTNWYDLTDANANVTSFATDTTDSKHKAAQTFYLAKASGDTNYQLAVPGAATQVDKNFAKFYELTAISTQPTNDATLQTAVDASDVYVVVTANAGNDGETVTKIAKGTTVAGGANAWDGDNTYYTAAADAATPASGKVYVYASKATAAAQGAAAGFKYIGKLSNAKESWNSTDDIKAVAITYTITGVTATNYNAVKTDCTYGLYTPVTGPQMTVSNAGLLSITGLTAEKNYQSITITVPEGTYNIDDDEVTWDESQWSEANGGTLSAQLGSGWINSMKGNACKVVLTLSDRDTVEITVTIPA